MPKKNKMNPQRDVPNLEKRLAQKEPGVPDEVRVVHSEEPNIADGDY